MCPVASGYACTTPFTPVVTTTPQTITPQQGVGFTPFAGGRTGVFNPTGQG